MTVGSSYLDNVEGLVDGSLGVEGVVSIDLSGDLSWDDLQDLLAELDEETVEGGVDLVVDVCSTVLLAVGDGNIDESGILWLLGGSQDQGRVGGGILWLVLADGYIMSVCCDVAVEASCGRHGLAQDC